MRAIIVFDSMFGNTRQIAYAIADGMRTYADVEIFTVDDAPRRLDERVGLVVIGGPTHAHGLSTQTSRRVNTHQAAQGATAGRIGLKEWLIGLATPSRPLTVATFDTRFSKPRWLTGSAAVLTARWLVRRGCNLIAPPESYYVEHGAGPLMAGELDRARRWGATLARAIRTIESARR
jgi:hypothetical protein